jgi:hypothetical protein
MMPIRGSLVAGQWQEPLEGGGFPPPDGAFIGDIDRMLLWDKPLSPTEVMLHAQTPILGPQDGLTMLDHHTHHHLLQTIFHKLL